MLLCATDTAENGSGASNGEDAFFSQSYFPFQGSEEDGGIPMWHQPTSVQWVILCFYEEGFL